MSADRESTQTRRTPSPEIESDNQHPPSDIRHSVPERRLSIKFWRAVVVLLCRVYHHLKVRNRNPLPKSGAAILVCNHISGLDPFLLQSVSPRLIIWMMAKEYYDMKALNWFFRTVEAIPVNRGSRDSAISTRAAIRTLESGRVLGIFPEGKISTTSELLQFHVGVAMIALRTGVPVYPAYLEGTTRGKEMVQAVLHPNSVSLRFGPRIPLDYSEKGRKNLKEATEAIRSAVESLRQAEIRLVQQKNPTV